MINIDIPGYKKIEAYHLVLDFNGTLAVDGKLTKGIMPLLELMDKQLDLHVLTADTFGTSERELEGINCKLKILKPESQDIQKGEYVIDLGKDHVIAIGNGQNDVLMLRQAALGIAVIQQEGTFSGLLGAGDIMCFSITDALNLIMNPLRIIATLRK